MPRIQKHFKIKLMKKHGLLLTLCLITLSVSAQDRLFTHTYQSIVLNQGQREIEVWNTLRTGKDQFYRALDSRVEYEFGIAKNLQVAFYLNAGSTTFESYDEIGSKQIESKFNWGFSNEWKWKLSDASANKMGSALYGELGVSGDEIELEFKVILDKQIGRVLQAVNLVSELEFETEIESSVNDNGQLEQEIENELEFSFDVYYGLSYNVNTNWNLGFEAAVKNGFHDGELENSALFAGPGFSYVKGPIWINFTLMPQLAGLKNESGTGLVTTEYEKFQTRLIFSYAL